MSIEVTCPGCQTVYPVPENLAGKTIRCKSCGEMMEVAAAAPAAKPAPAKLITAKAAPAKPMPAKPASRVVVEDDEDDVPAKPIRRPRDEDDDDAPAEKKKSSLPLILGGVLGLLVVVGVGVGALFATGVIGGKADPAVAKNTQQVVSQPVTDEAASDKGEDAKTDTPPPATTPTAEKKTEPAGTPAAIPPRGPEKNREPLLPSVPTPTRQPAAEAKNASPPAPTRDTPDQKTIDMCKNAAVLLEVISKTAAGFGTGWFGMEEGLIFTNAHVLHMLTPGSQKPTKITVYINPGTPQQRAIPHQRIEILAVDRAMDLALLRVTGEQDLPKPLKVRPSAELRELEKLAAFGYPGGRRLAQKNKSARMPAVTISKTEVMTLRRDDDGNLYSVQVAGGIVHGNSGGPIVDADGNVVGVAVRVDLDDFGRFTNIAYGVPTEYVTGLLAGRVANIEFGQAYRQGGLIHIPVTAECIDPLSRLKEVGIGAWVGDMPVKDAPRKPRLPGVTRTGAEPSDSNYVEAQLQYKFDKEKQVATGEFVLPEPPAGRTYWAQPYYSNALVTKYWLAGNAVKLPGPPIERTPADLIVKYKPNTRRSLTLSNSLSLNEYGEGEGEEKSDRVHIEMGVKGLETILAPQQGDTTSHAILRLNYEKVDFALQKGDRKANIPLPKELRDLFGQTISKGIGFGYVNKAGVIYRNSSDTRSLQPPLNQLFQGINHDVMESLSAASISLPNSRVDPNHTWKNTTLRQLTLRYIEPGEQSLSEGNPQKGPRPKEPAKAPKTRTYKYSENMTFTYLGTRTRAGTKEGVIRIEGTITAAPGVKIDEGATGEFKGYAYVDLDTGEIVEAEVNKEFEIDTSGDGEKKKVSGLNTYKLSRGGVAGR